MMIMMIWVTLKNGLLTLLPTLQDFYLDKVFRHEHFQELGPRDNDIALVKIQRKHGRGMR